VHKDRVADNQRAFMTTSNLNRLWTPVVILLVVIIIVGGITAWLRYSPGRSVEISLSESTELRGEIYIDGAVANPGIYPLLPGDTVEGLIGAAGGASGSANLSGIEFYIPANGENKKVQKIDINRAEVWLLMALPGIGETLAQRIVDYREENGPYRSISELQKVSGIGAATYERIRDLITVAD
jgi:competence protein ComEA